MSTHTFPAKTGDNPLGSATDFAAVTPSDSADLAYTSRGLYVGGAGNLTVRGANSTTSVTFTAVPAGTVLPIAVSRVMATGTTATSIVSLY